MAAASHSIALLMFLLSVCLSIGLILTFSDDHNAPCLRLCVNWGDLLRESVTRLSPMAWRRVGKQKKIGQSNQQLAVWLAGWWCVRGREVSVAVVVVGFCEICLWCDALVLFCVSLLALLPLLLLLVREPNTSFSIQLGTANESSSVLSGHTSCCGRKKRRVVFITV